MQKQFLTASTEAHNLGLDTALNSLSLSYGINIYDVDVNSLFANAIATPESFGFTNVTDACLNLSSPSICSNPDQYLLWDDLHPTTAAHAQISDLASARLNSEPIPEPNSGLGILALGALGAIAKLQYTKKIASVNR